MVQPDIRIHEERFAAYAASFAAESEPMLRLKVEHTAAVVRNARRIAEENQALFGPDAGRAFIIAAQYHDIGRFPQFQRWRTFKDAASVDHGSLGCRILCREGFLDDEPEALRRLVRVAVCLHNRRVLPAGLAGVDRLVSEGVRDADKLDIFRVMARYLAAEPTPKGLVLSVRDEPDKWSPAVAETVLRGEVPSYADLAYVNDFRMVLVSWLRELHFPVTRRELAVSGYAQAVLDGLPDAPGLRPARDALYALICEAGAC